MIIGKHISEVTLESKKIILDRKDGIVKPLASPWNKVNSVIMDGFEWGTMTTIGGMSGAGKTAFASQLYRDIHKNNPSEDFIILFFTFEMTAAKLILRDIIASTKIYREYLLSAKGNVIDTVQLDNVDKYLASIKDKPIFFIEKPKTGADYIKICRAYHDKYKKKIMAIADHSLLFKGKATGDREMLVDLAEEIVELKNEGWSMHFLLSQLNREIERSERRHPCSPLNYPDKSCLFASDALYQASDYVFLIHRPYLLKFAGDTYGPDKLSTNIDKIYFHIVKNREGEPTLVKMQADFRAMRILDGI